MCITRGKVVRNPSRRSTRKKTIFNSKTTLGDLSKIPEDDDNTDFITFHELDEEIACIKASLQPNFFYVTSFRGTLFKVLIATRDECPTLESEKKLIVIKTIKNPFFSKIDGMDESTKIL